MNGQLDRIERKLDAIMALLTDDVEKLRALIGEPEETVTEDRNVVSYVDEDGELDWYDADAPSARLEAKAVCPCCGKTAVGDDQIEERFGYRRMKPTDKKVRKQSWCRVCRVY